MGEYSTSIKKLNAELLAFINRYEILDDKDPITNALLKKLKKQINSLNTTSNQYVTTLNRQNLNFENSFNELMKQYKIDCDEVNENLITAIELITHKYEKKNTELKDEISKLKKACNEKLSILQQDIEFFIISSNQRESIFENELEENLKRFEYQIIAAKMTYNDNINAYNASLKQSLETLKREYATSLISYDKNSHQLIEKLNEKITECSRELEDVSSKLNAVRIDMKEKFRQESIYLNNEIYELVDEKNKSIVNARTHYSKSQNNSTMEKENKRQEYQLEGQKILRDFVYNMTEIDEYTNTYKNNHIVNVENEKRNFYYAQLALIKKQNNEIKDLADLGHVINNDYDKVTKHLMKGKKKAYYKLLNQMKKSEFKKLEAFELLYQKEIEKTRNTKALLDLDKSYSLKLLSEKEQSDNKYYQELNNIYENDMNLAIKISNLEYNQKANIVKCQSRIRNKELEKDLDISEANFQKKIETIQCSINKYKFEIDGTVELNKLVHKYEEKNYKRKENNLSVNTLLEIEKCKLLDEYNRRQYNDNILNSKTNLAYSKKKLELENQKFESLSNIRIEQIKTALQRDIVNITYKIKENQVFEYEDQNVQTRNTQYELDSLNHTILYERFKGEVRILHQILSTFILLVKEIESFSSKFLATFISSISVRSEYFNMIDVFVNDFLHIIMEYYKSIVNNLVEHESDVIYKRIEFEEKFKFKSYYTELLSTYEENRKKLLKKKNSITDTLENYDKTVDNFRGRVYNLENQVNLIRQKIGETHTSDKKILLKNELINHKQKIFDFKNKIEDILKLKKILEKDNINISEELKTLEKEYNDRLIKIKNMQYDSAISFHNLRKNFAKSSANIIQRVSSIVPKKKQSLMYFQFESFLNECRHEVSTFNTKFFTELYGMINTFYHETNSAILKDKQILLFQNKDDMDKIHFNAMNRFEENKRNYNKKVSNYIEQLKNLENGYEEKEKYFDHLIETCTNQYETEIKQIIHGKKMSLYRFYSEYYAMCDNQNEINENYKNEDRRLSDAFQKDKIELTKRIISEKDGVSLDLENFIRAKEELINHLPTATKFQSQQLHKETREINATLQKEIKESKFKFNLERKNIQRNVSNIEYQLQQILNENEVLHQKEINKEKRNHYIQLKHLEKNIRV